MITPIIMESDLTVVAAKMLALKERKIDSVHIDIGDGLFSDMLSISPADLQELDTSRMKMDIHLLVDDPLEWIEECVALNPRRLIGQIERMGSQEIFLESVAGYGIAGGLALKIETPVEEIEEKSLRDVKVILLLAIPPGTSGLPFDERVLPKIKELRKVYNGSILIDGGINKMTYKQIIQAGATEAGANSAYWKGEL
jgi:ribulose-phosphate 3-epimerase